MGAEYTMTVTKAAEYLGCSKSYVQRLIRQGRLDAILEEVPIRYYLIDPSSVEAYKLAPKSKGGRPRRIPEGETAG